MARYEVSIEIMDAAFPASSWQRAYGDIVTNAAMSWSGLDWDWHEHRWGLVLEIAFPSEAEYDNWREVPAVVSALDAVPDPVNGLIFHRGWGGTSSSAEPRRPRPPAGAGGAEVPVVVEPDTIEAMGQAIARNLVSSVRTAASA